MPTKRVPKTEEIIVIQGNYGSHGWEDVSAYSKAEAKQAREDLRAYRHSGAGVYRLIRRRVDRVTQEPAKRGSRLTAADKRFRATMSRIGKPRSNPATSRKKASDPGASRVKVYRGRARVSDDGFGNDAYYTLEGSRVKVAMANPRAHSWDESGGSDRDGEFILLRTNLRDAKAVLEPLGYVVRAFRR